MVDWFSPSISQLDRQAANVFTNEPADPQSWLDTYKSGLIYQSLAVNVAVVGAGVAASQNAEGNADGEGKGLLVSIRLGNS